jgi:hypothetical protein
MKFFLLLFCSQKRRLFLLCGFCFAYVADRVRDVPALTADAAWGRLEGFRVVMIR